jgi:hypothetical protein
MFHVVVSAIEMEIWLSLLVSISEGILSGQWFNAIYEIHPCNS